MLKKILVFLISICFFQVVFLQANFLKKFEGESDLAYVTRINYICSFIYLQDDLFKNLRKLFKDSDLKFKAVKEGLSFWDGSYASLNKNKDNGDLTVFFEKLSQLAHTKDEIAACLRLSKDQKKSLLKVVSSYMTLKSPVLYPEEKVEEYLKSQNIFVVRIGKMLKIKKNLTDANNEFKKSMENVRDSFHILSKLLCVDKSKQYKIEDDVLKRGMEKLDMGYDLSYFYQTIKNFMNNNFFSSDGSEKNYSVEQWNNKLVFAKKLSEKYDTKIDFFHKTYDDAHIILIENLKKFQESNIIMFNPTIERFLSQQFVSKIDKNTLGTKLKDIETISFEVDEDDGVEKNGSKSGGNNKKKTKLVCATEVYPFLGKYNFLPAKLKKEEIITDKKIETKKKKKNKKVSDKKIQIKKKERNKKKVKTENKPNKVQNKPVKKVENKEIKIVEPQTQETDHYVRFKCPATNLFVTFYKANMKPIQKFKFGKLHERITRWELSNVDSMVRKKYDLSKYSFSIYESNLLVTNQNENKKLNLMKINHLAGRKEFMDRMFSIGIETVWNSHRGNKIEKRPCIIIPGEIELSDGGRMYGVFSMTFYKKDGLMYPYHYCFTDMTWEKFLDEDVTEIYQKIHPGEW